MNKKKSYKIQNKCEKIGKFKNLEKMNKKRENLKNVQKYKKYDNMSYKNDR